MEEGGGRGGKGGGSRERLKKEDRAGELKQKGGECGERPLEETVHWCRRTQVPNVLLFQP